jgi:hypothetical protein
MSLATAIVKLATSDLFAKDPNTGQHGLSDHLKTGQRRSGQNRPTRAAGTELFYSAESFGGKLVLVRQLRGPHLSTCP